MAINFDALPQENPFSIPEAGIYRAKIAEAQMKKGKDLTKPAYLSLKYAITNRFGESKGTLYDGMYESDSSVVQYKLGRFLQACGIPLTGSMELSDVAKLVNGKEIVIDIMHDKKSDPVRAQVDIFSREGYWPIGEFESVCALAYPEESHERPPADSFVPVSETADGATEVPFDSGQQEY